MSYIVIWKFDVRPANLAQFESAYGPRGDWAQLFSRYAGFESVELVRAASHSPQYVTIDRWRSCEEYHAMRDAAAEEYARLDARCEGFTSREQEIGSFESIG